MTDSPPKQDIEKSLEAFRKMSEHINAQMKPLFVLSNDWNKRVERISEPMRQSMAMIESASEPMRQAMEKIQGWSEEIFKKFESTLENIQKIQDNHNEGKEIRGDIITSVIDLDEMLEEIILKKYVKKELFDEFTKNMLFDESCSSSLKFKVVARSGLLEAHEGLKKGVQALLEIRNIIAHSKYQPTVQTVEILHKGDVKDIHSLKKEFDSIFKEVMEKLGTISRELE